MDMYVADLLRGVVLISVNTLFLFWCHFKSDLWSRDVQTCLPFSTECAHLLLAHNAPVKVKNAQGWSPLAEAISYGDRQMSK